MRNTRLSTMWANKSCEASSSAYLSSKPKICFRAYEELTKIHICPANDDNINKTKQELTTGEMTPKNQQLNSAHYS